MDYGELSKNKTHRSSVIASLKSLSPAYSVLPAATPSARLLNREEVYKEAKICVT